MEPKIDSHILDRHKTWLICPRCRNFPSIDVTFGENDIMVNLSCSCHSEDDDMETTFTLKEYLDIIKSKKIFGAFCDLDKSHSNYQAVTYCFNCDKFLCSFCVSFHKALNSDHKLSDEEVHVETQCKRHIENAIVAYCKDCNESLCATCVDEHDKMHRVIMFKGYFDKELFDEKRKSYQLFKERQKNRDEVYQQLVEQTKDTVEAKKLMNEAKEVYEMNKKINEGLDEYLSLVFMNYDDTIIETPNFNIIENAKKVSTFNLNEFIIDDSKSIKENINAFMTFYKKNFAIKLPDTPFEVTLTQQYKCRGICTLAELPSNMLAVSTWNNTIDIYNALTLTETSRNLSHFAPSMTLLPLRNGSFASGSNDYNINIWTSEANDSNYDVTTYLSNHEGAVSKLIEMPNGDIVSSSWDQTLRVWSNGEEVAVLKGHTDKVSDVSMMKDGNIISCGFDGKVIIWDMKTKNVLKTVVLGEKGVKCYKVMQLMDGRLLIALSVSNEENKTNKYILKLTDKNIETIKEIEMTEIVISLIQLDDGRVILVTKDHKGIVYDVKTFEVLFDIGKCFKGESMIGSLIQLKNGMIICENIADSTFNILS